MLCEVSEMDKRHLSILRENVLRFLEKNAAIYDRPGCLLLDVAPQDYAGAAAFFCQVQIETLDIDSSAAATYTADLCVENRDIIQEGHFDFVVCTEVLEHVLDPFAAVKEIHRILKLGGIAFVSVPFNFRIHGPLPDCWRFTRYGLEVLFKDFSIIKLEELETEGRGLMPIQYTLVARKD